ncbi:MAG: PAS domain S-box protein [Allosphingosinicella sp.]
MDDDSRFRLLIDAVTDYAIYMLDANGVVASWNPGARRFKGYEADEIIGQHFSRFYTEEDRAAGIPARALATAAGEGRFEAEAWRVRKDGSRFWAHVVIDPIRAPDGTIVGYAKVTRDLTDRRQAEEALRRSEERFRLLVEGVTDYAIYMLDPGGIISSWNAGAERFKGYTAEEIIGEHFSRFYTPEDRAGGLPERALATAGAEGRFENEGWRVRKDGSRFWAHVIIDAIRDPMGALVGFAKITRDLTERRETQQALDEAREAFFQSQKMEAVGRLTGGVAHDFNNLLMAVMGSLELLRRRLPDDPKATRLLENATQAAQRGAALTQRMLAFARRQQLDLAPVDLPELVRGMSELLERSLGPSVTLALRFPRALPKVTADANQLELALLNLAMNARDAMPDGGPIVIAARTESVPEGGELEAGTYVCLSVEDRGEGMDDETLARATEPFFTTKGVGKGTGLGLSMVHGLAEQSGGRLTLASRPGEGTVATLWLPAAESREENGESTAAPSAAPPRARRLKVLAVDDDPLVLMNTLAMLEELGHEAREARSGRQALELLGEGDFDLLVSDYAMPHMTGLELAEAARAERPGLPILIVTGFADLVAGEDLALPRLSKPFTQAELASALDEALERRPSGDILHFKAG